MPEGADLRLKMLRGIIRSIDAISRALSGAPFFAVKEAEALLIELDGRTGHALVAAMLEKNGGTEIVPRGLENVPKTGPVIIGSTHPIGTFDFIAHAGALLDHRPDLKVVANREAERFLGAECHIAVDVDRSDKVTTARKTIDAMQSHLRDGGAVLIFGSGRVPPLRDGYLKERKWRSGITRVSAMTGAPIIPASADMRNSRHFYKTYDAVHFLTRGNEYAAHMVASFRYVSELLEKLGGRYEVHYGQPLQPGLAPEEIQKAAEALVPGLYRS